MIPDWRRWLSWRRDVAGVSMPPDEKTIEKKEPLVSREDGVERLGVARMEFLLSLRRRGIGDAAVLRAMDTVPREDFMLPPFAVTAYADQAAPIDCGQTISQPYVVAYMTEQLGLKRDHRVLEVGTGSGYQAAILSQLAGLVYSVE